MARKASIPNVGSVSMEKRREAWQAASRFRELLPQLTDFARSVTGNEKVKVVATHLGPHSIGNKIFIRPPLALGRAYGHDRQDCGRRGDDGRQSCQACRVREVVDFYLYHEIGHVWQGTQDRATSEVWDLFHTITDMWHPSGACDHGPAIKARAREHEECMPIANSFHRYLGLILNGLEDARVNEAMFDTRPGLRRIFDVNIERMMVEGSESAVTDEPVTWHDAPADAQFTVGLCMMACGYDPREWLHPDVVQVLADPRLVDITSRARHALSVHEVFTLSVRSLMVAQTLGFCVIPKCEVPGPKSNDQEDPDGGDEQGRMEPGSSPSSGSGGSGSAESSAASDSSDGSDGPGSPGDQGTPEVPDEEDNDSSSGDGDEDRDAPNNGPGAPVEPDSLDDDEADEAESTGGGGGDGEDDDASDGRRPEPPSNGDVPDGDSESEVSAGQSSAGSAGSPAPTGAEANTEQPDDQSSTDRGADGSDSDGDGDDADPSEGSDGQDDEGDSEADGEVGPDPQDHYADPWSVAAPDETGSDDDPLPGAGTVEDAERALAPLLMHGTEEFDGMLEEMLGEDLSDILNDIEEGTREFVNGQPLIMVAISQVAFFDDPSAAVAGVEVIKFPCPEIGWEAEDGIDWTNFQPSEMAVGGAIMHARRVFQNNHRARLDRNRRSGKVNSRVLGKRAPVGDDRLFAKKTQPKRHSYLVIITGDCSGSTQSYGRSAKIRRMMMAQGDVLNRIGVPFIMMGHSAARCRSAKFEGPSESDYWMYALTIKDEHEGWGPITKNRLAAMGPVSENLDGHTLEYCRKMAEKSNATDVIIIYYTDGEMPAANATEEREILVREIKTCKKKGYHLLGVGINTDSPKRYGMKTVKVESDDDIALVIKQLEEELTA